jgi:AhpD family alkylhydroperoxidase
VSDLEAQNQSEASLLNYKQGLGTFTQKMPHLARAYNEFTEICFQEGKLSKKEKQLIALGISIHAQDEYCMIYHLKGCIDQGCTEEEIFEAIGVSAAFGGGAVMSQAVTLVQQVMNDFKKVN